MTWLMALNWARKNWLPILIALAALGLYMLGRSHGAAGPKAELAAYKAEVKAAVERQLVQNGLKEAEDKRVFAEIAKQYEQDKQNAQAKADAVIAGLRNGNIKLHWWWVSCKAAQAADGSSGIDEAARLREESAARIIGNAAEADSWITRLQDVIRQLQEQPVQ